MSFRILHPQRTYLHSTASLLNVSLKFLIFFVKLKVEGIPFWCKEAWFKCRSNLFISSLDLCEYKFLIFMFHFLRSKLCMWFWFLWGLFYGVWKLESNMFGLRCFLDNFMEEKWEFMHSLWSMHWFLALKVSYGVRVWICGWLRHGSR